MSPREQQSPTRVVLLGASAGGVEALSTVVHDLPTDLDAAVLVVLHVPAWGTSVLPEILSRVGPLPARHAEDCEPLKPGRIYVAPPDQHLVVETGQLRLSHGPKENGVRPAVDVLFRSGAHAYSRRAIAAVLSGTLDDGTAGLVSVKSHGGVTIVQDPHDAVFPGMPESAVRFAHPGHVVPLREIGPLIAKCVAEDPDDLDPNPSARKSQEDQMAQNEGRDASGAQQPGKPSELNCPDCGGTLWEMTDGDLLRFRCRVGHAYSPESLFSQQLESLEGALWAAVVALQERADLAERLMHRMRERGNGGAAERYARQAVDARRRAEQVREAIIHLSRTGETGSDRTAQSG